MKCEGENLVFHESLVNIGFVQGTEWTLLFTRNFEPFQNIPTTNQQGSFFPIQQHIFTQTGVKYEKFLNPRVWLIEFKEEGRK